MPRRPLTLAAACAALLVSAAPARAVITKLTPLKEVLDDYQYIFLAKVDEVRSMPAPPGMILTVSTHLKGAAPFPRLPVNLKGDDYAGKNKHTEAMLERVEKDVLLIVFVEPPDNDKQYFAVGYTNGTWFSMNGRTEKADGKEVVRWSFQHCEPFLRRTFKGTTDELKQAITDVLQKKKEPPSPDEKERPGLGPPLRKKSALPATAGGLYAVIQLPFLGAIAALAALFPAVFGGLALTMRRWMVALSIASLVSLLYFVVFFAEWVDWPWLRAPQGFWMSCAAIAALGALGAARRYRRALQAGKADDMQSRRLDRAVLVVAAVGGFAWLLLEWRGGARLSESPWLELLVAWVPIAAATWFTVTTYLRARKLPVPHPASAVSAETVTLWGLVFSCGFAGALEAGRDGRSNRPDGTAIIQNESAANPGDVALRVQAKPVWVFEPKDGGIVQGMPCVTPQGIVVSVGHQRAFRQYGRVYCLDPRTGQERWSFGGGDERMEYAFSSPVYAEGHVYVGEGLHYNENCRLFCLDAATGQKRWAFPTRSHTESTPCVVQNKVIFGAGNDGIYCLDATTGAQLWHYIGEAGLHVDSNPTVHEGRVYAGSGLSQAHQVNRIFCLDLQTGQELWGERVEHSAYGSPAVRDGVVYFGIGNGNFSADRDPVYGALLARDARTGARKWDRSLPNSVLGKPAADGRHVYLGTRDGHLYALNPETGMEVWKQGLGGPVLASPVADFCPGCGRTEAIYAAGDNGRVVALSPETGNVHWTLEISILAQKPNVTLTATPVLLRETDGPKVRRQVLIGVGVADSRQTKPTARLYCFEDELVH